MEQDTFNADRNCPSSWNRPANKKQSMSCVTRDVFGSSAKQCITMVCQSPCDGREVERGPGY
eukprot:9000150-Prorocentrum_lima.AAC.1